MMPPRSRPANVTETAYELLLQGLMTGRFRPGAQLKIGELCQDLGLNLSAVREALARLSSEGLVIAEPQRGYRAAPISSEDLSDLTQTRLDIETLCLRRSIELGDVQWESQIVGAYHALSRMANSYPAPEDLLAGPLREAHESFHETLCSACGSPWLLRLRALLHRQSERYRLLSGVIARYRRPADDEHRALRDAVLARDADRAAELIKDHFNTTISYLLEQDDTDRPDAAASPATGSDTPTSDPRILGAINAP